MNSHIGFRVTATPPGSADPQVENFELRQAAIDCAQLLDGKGWTHIRCLHVTSRVRQFEFDSCEEFADIEWQCHLVGGTL